MKENSKDRIKVTLIILVFLVFVSIIGIGLGGALGFIKTKPIGMFTGPVVVVDESDTERIDSLKKYGPYAFKVKEDDNFYLMHFSWESDKPVEHKIKLTEKEFDSILIGKVYKFDFKLDKKDDNKGEIREIHPQN